ncbi:MAG: hemN [Rickettsiaceae bacterium]|nr:hemN [Rickettsiaceae bacterium]
MGLHPKAAKPNHKSRIMLAIYIHWPFCKSKCPYCDFNSHVKDKINHADFAAAYIAEMDYFADIIKGQTISSIFFGGGTPTLMPPSIAGSIINNLSKYAKLDSNIEITLEGNPTSIEAEKFRQFKDAGINRVSLGVQSLNEDDLKFLGREHSKNEALRAVEIAANVFHNYSFDLIYARPEQKISSWEKELTEGLKYIKNHMSLYQLTIEKGTKFYGAYNAGAFTMPSNDLSAEFFEVTNDIMDSHSLPAYEISNHAAGGFESRHNLTYWNYGNYLGLGAGAHSRVTINDKKTALMMIHSPEGWLKSVQDNKHAIQTETELSPEEILDELVMMGLRIKDGISRDNFKNVTGFSFEEKLHNLDYLQNAGMIVVDDKGLRATKKGRIMVNAITGKLLEI